MVERSHSFNLSRAETTDLRIAHYERKEVVEKLKDEIDAEREASATSASEALSMILRLQGEKAELEMETDQYKRMVEDQMFYAEMSFAVLEDCNYQKEIEITALEYQVDAYRSQLLSLGFSDFNSLDVKLEKNDDQDENMLKKMKMNDRSQTPTDFSIPVEKEVIEQSLDSQRNVYWEQIKKLDKQVKELTQFRDSMRDQYKGAEDFASSSNFQEDKTRKEEEAKGLCKSDETLVRNVSKQKKKTRDRTGKRNCAEFQAELQRLRERVERLERGRTNTENETSREVKQEEITLQKEVKEELNIVQLSEEKSLNTIENLQPWIDPTIVSVQEAMLYFWL